MISCGLGVSALNWARRNIAPFSIQFRGNDVLVLVSRQIALNPERVWEINLVDSHPKVIEGSHYLLLARTIDAGKELCSVGLFPPGIRFETPRRSFTDRLKETMRNKIRLPFPVFAGHTRKAKTVKGELGQLLL
jgi:hypothetical protein